MPTAADIILNSIALTENVSVDSDQSVNEYKKTKASVADTCTFESATGKIMHNAFLRECVDIVLENAIFKGSDRRNPVINFKSPQELQEVMDFTLTYSPSTHEKMVEHIKNVIKYSVKTSHPYFMNQLFSRYIQSTVYYKFF